MPTRILTQELLKQLVHYDPLSGIFTWLPRPGQKLWNARYAGKRAGNAQNHGYVQLTLKGKKWLAHRAAFLYMEGRFPPEKTDHINHDRADNRWSNLRAVSNGENSKNNGLSGINTSGVPGVSLTKRKSWSVRIVVFGRRIGLGHYKDFFLAVCARKSAEAAFGYHPNHGEALETKYFSPKRKKP